MNYYLPRSCYFAYFPFDFLPQIQSHAMNCTCDDQITNSAYSGTRNHLRIFAYFMHTPCTLPMCGFIAQLVEHHTGIAEVTGSNPVEALIFIFRVLLSNCLSWKIDSDHHFSLSKYILPAIMTSATAKNTTD